MSKEFAFEVSWFDYRNESRNEKRFQNSYGNWTVLIQKFYGSISGFLTFKPAYEVDIEWIKRIEIIFSFYKSNSPDYVKNSRVHDEGFFYFDPFNPSVDSVNYRITLKIRVPETIPYSNIRNSKSHLKELFESEKLSDFTIKTKSNEFKVHKIILMRSEVFDRMLNNVDTKESQTNTIEITDINHDVIFEMCRYLYTDEIPKIEELAHELLIAADKYNIPRLAMQCGEYLTKNKGIESFHDVLIIADNLNLKDLKKMAIDFVVENRKTIFSSENWKNLKKYRIQLVGEVAEKLMEKL